MDFGTWLAGRRQQAEMTQRELARRCAVTPAYVAHLESGTSEAPPLQTCKDIARALGLEWRDVWQHSFASRLRRWLRREGYSVISDPELLDLVKRIESVSK